MKSCYASCRSLIVDHTELCRIEFHWELNEILWFEVWCSNLSLLDLDLLAWIRKKHVRIVVVHDETNWMMYRLSNLVKKCSCWKFVDERDECDEERVPELALIHIAWLLHAFRYFSAMWPIISCHCIKWNAAFHHCCSIITKLPFSVIKSFISFSFSIFISFCMLILEKS